MNDKTLTVGGIRELIKGLSDDVVIAPRFDDPGSVPDDMPSVKLHRFEIVKETYSDAPEQTILAAIVSQTPLDGWDDDEEDETWDDNVLKTYEVKVRVTAMTTDSLLFEQLYRVEAYTPGEAEHKATRLALDHPKYDTRANPSIVCDEAEEVDGEDEEDDLGHLDVLSDKDADEEGEDEGFFHNKLSDDA